MNIPNALTILRMLMIPLMVYVFNNFGAEWAMGVYVLASLTDILDGYIARKYNQITNFGKLMDPLADKLMVISMLIMLVINAYIPMWVLIVIACKELMMVAGAALLLGGKKVVVMANKLGKAATFAFFVSIVLVCLRDVWLPLWTVGVSLVYVAVALSIIAMIGYARAYLIQGRNDRT
jgi:cardiolipin synthase